MEGRQEGEKCFEKKLSFSDINVALEIPDAAAKYLPPGDEDMHVLRQNEPSLTFQAGTRPNGRRFMKYEWRRFVKEADLNVGDTLILHRFYNFRLFGRNMHTHGKQSVYKVEIRRH